MHGPLIRYIIKSLKNKKCQKGYKTGIIRGRGPRTVSLVVSCSSF